MRTEDIPSQTFEFSRMRGEVKGKGRERERVRI